MRVRVLEASLIAALLLLVAPTYAEPCTVLDSELQGYYEGGCWNGLASGKGHARGSAEYVGEFRKGMKHGYGVKTWPWGDRYEGEFREDYRHGDGMYVWGAGSQWAGERYVGEYVRDARQGQGTYYWPNGDRFDGLWKEDLRYGYTAMEQRREAAFQARQAALAEAGTKVCARVKVGIAQDALVEAVTEQLEQDVLTVRVTAVGDAGAGPQPALRDGDMVRSSIWDWTPCS